MDINQETGKVAVELIRSNQEPQPAPNPVVDNDSNVMLTSHNETTSGGLVYDANPEGGRHYFVHPGDQSGNVANFIHVDPHASAAEQDSQYNELDVQFGNDPIGDIDYTGSAATTIRNNVT
jgi:hypothetical protein